MSKSTDRFVSASEQPQPNYVWIIDRTTGHAREVALFHARETLELLNHFNTMEQVKCIASK